MRDMDRRLLEDCEVKGERVFEVPHECKRLVCVPLFFFFGGITGSDRHARATQFFWWQRCKCNACNGRRRIQECDTGEEKDIYQG
jgi:hypothetical protein